MSALGSLGLAASLIVAAVFVVAGIAKLSDRDGTSTTLREFGAPASMVRLLALVLPLAEILVAGLLVAVRTRTIGSAAALGLLFVFSSAIGYRLAGGNAPSCNCFGQLHSAPVSWRTLVRNGALSVLAGTALAAALAGKSVSAVAWIGRLSGLGVLALVLAVTSVLFVAGGFAAFLSLLRSHGAVLLRLDEVEKMLAEERRGNGAAEEDVPASVDATAAPAFAIANTDGTVTSLTDLLAPGLPLLLLFTSQSCGPCRSLLPKVASWQDKHADRVTIAVANGGDRGESISEERKHRLEHVIIDGDLTLYEAYRAGGTPSAVLVATDGTIAGQMASGAGAIEALLDAALAGLGRTNDATLHVGSPAPELIVPTLDGESVNLGRVEEETLLLFWNPGCGFCSSMRDDVLAWEQHMPVGAPRLVVVSSGSEASVREEGFSSIVALDPEFSAGAAFGAGGTPMAILVDGRGRIASSLAGGAEAVFALAGGRGNPDSESGMSGSFAAKR